MNFRNRMVTTLVIVGIAAMIVPALAASQSRPDFLANLKPTALAHQPFSKVQGHAWFYLNERGTRLRYEIKVNGLEIDGHDIPGKGKKDSVVAAQLRHAPLGLDGPVVLTFFGDMGEDDGNLRVDSVVGTISGVWDNGDSNEATGSQRMTDMLDYLCAGELYVEIRTASKPGGALRGQIHAQPRVCR